MVGLDLNTRIRNGQMQRLDKASKCAHIYVHAYAHICAYMCKELHLTFPFCLIGVGTGVLYAQYARKDVK